MEYPALKTRGSKEMYQSSVVLETDAALKLEPILKGSRWSYTSFLNALVAEIPIEVLWFYADEIRRQAEAKEANADE